MNLFRDRLASGSEKYLIATYEVVSETNLKEAAWNIAIGQSVGNPNVRSLSVSLSVSVRRLKPNPIGDDNRNLLALTKYQDLPEDEKKKDLIIVSFLRKCLI